jgi:HK97 gp10 family phage protein
MAGFKELENALLELPKAVGKKVLREALKKAAQPVVWDAQRNVPVLTGELLGSIDIRATLSKRQRRGRAKAGDVEMFIGPSWPKGAHGHLVEFGTSKMAARPFLRPAWDANKNGVLASIGRELWIAIDKAAKRLARKAAKLRAAG